MGESVTTTSPTNTAISPTTGPSSLGSPVVATISEAAHYDFKPGSREGRGRSHRRPSAASRHDSPASSVHRSFDEKHLEDGPAPGPASAAVSYSVLESEPHEPAKESNGFAGNGYGQGQAQRQAQAPNRLSKPMTSSKEKERRGGFRNTIRRMFGRSRKSRISMPTPIVYPRHDPEEFITSATAVDSNPKPQRAASVPNANMPRTSALNSHPPFRPTTVATSDPASEPPPPDRRAPERPPRPRSASVPSELLNREDVQAVEAALSDPHLQEQQERNLEARQIGFAVTNGSNPKRRSRSAGAYPGVDHRMSPIQWHHVRRRSDEIKYWRESTPMAFDDLRSEPRPDTVSPPPAVDDEDDDDDEAGPTRATDGPPDLGPRPQPFNFGLPGDTTDLDMQSHERIGLEERLVTLEIKLMDFEYMLSKIQAGSTLVSQRNSFLDPAKRQASIDGSSPTDAPRSRFGDSPVPAPGTFAGDPAASKARPTSVATTLKPHTHQATYSTAERPPTDRLRASLTTPTIEHYSALITLIRHEQAARQRLEETVTQLQAQVDRLTGAAMPRSPNSSGPSHSHSHSHSYSHSYSASTSSQRRHGYVEPDSHPRAPVRLGHPHGQQRQRRAYRPDRGRSSSYSTDPDRTDTDDDWHDAAVMPSGSPSASGSGSASHTLDFPSERGEYERGAFERISVEEGVAF